MALRFHGQSPIAAVGPYTAFPGRTIGAVSGIAQQTDMLPLWSAKRNQTAAFGTLAAIPDGTTHPVSWLMALRAGRISSRNATVTFTVNGSGTMARPAVGSTSITFDVPAALLELIVSADGNISISFSLSATLAAAVPLAGDSSITFTVNNATLGAIIDAVANSSFQFILAGTQTAIGNLAGDITPFTPLSPQSLAGAVWAALSADYNATGTMGNKLNSAASAGDPWSTALPGSYAAGEAGYILGSQVLTEADLVRIADIVLRRATSNVEASSDGDTLSLKSLYGMIAQGVHNTQVSGSSLTVTRSDDTTVLGTRTVTTDPSAEPIVGIDSD